MNKYGTLKYGAGKYMGWIKSFFGRTIPVPYNLEEDISRVEIDMEYLSTKLLQYGYSAPVTTKLWKYGDKFTESDGIRMISNLNTLRSKFYAMSTTPTTPPDMQLLTTDDANNIEKIQFDLYTLFGRLLDSFTFSNEIYSGEAIF